MSDYGISDTGFNRKRLDVLLQELNSEMKTIFGDNFNVSPESPDGQVDGVISESNANLWELLEEAYNAFNPSAASGSSLSNLVQLNGITRIAASPTTAQLTITGVNATVIPLGSLVSTSDTKVQFSLDQEVIIPSGGSAIVAVSASKDGVPLTGPIEAAAGTITVIDTPISGWLTANNASDALLGTNEETDPELRSRRFNSVARDAQAIIDAIFAEVNAVPGVTQLTVLENDTDVTDVNGIPPHSIYVIVVGGDDGLIAQAIFLKKTLGANTFGTTLEAVLDSQNIPHDISFSRPVEVPIFVEVNLTPFDDYPVTGDEDIKQAIVDYANGALIPGRGFFLGDDVILSEIYTPVNTVPGMTVDSLFISLSSPAIGLIDIPIAIDSVSQFLTANIVVNSGP